MIRPLLRRRQAGDARRDHDVDLRVFLGDLAHGVRGAARAVIGDVGARDAGHAEHDDIVEARAGRERVGPADLEPLVVAVVAALHHRQQDGAAEVGEGRRVARGVVRGHGLAAGGIDECLERPRRDVVGVQRPAVVAHRGEDLGASFVGSAGLGHAPALDAQERVGAAGDVERVRAVGAAAAGRAAGRGHRGREVRREADLHGGRAGGRRSQEQEWAPHLHAFARASVDRRLGRQLFGAGGVQNLPDAQLFGKLWPPFDVCALRGCPASQSSGRRRARWPECRGVPSSAG